MPAAERPGCRGGIGPGDEAGAASADPLEPSDMLAADRAGAVVEDRERHMIALGAGAGDRRQDTVGIGGCCGDRRLAAAAPLPPIIPTAQECFHDGLHSYL